MTMRTSRPADRGAALITAIGLVAILLGMVLGLMVYTGQVHRRGIRIGRSLHEQACAESGLQIARSYFSSKYTTSQAWNDFLSHPEIYNPIGWPGGAHSIPKASPNASTAEVKAAADLRKNHPELFADLDGDGDPDVYIYIRDDDDDGNPTVDSNRQAYLGAVCISNTLVPRRADGSVDPSMAIVEGFGMASPDDDYAQKHGGRYGTGE
jgi:hypothetical protein